MSKSFESMSMREIGNTVRPSSLVIALVQTLALASDNDLAFHRLKINKAEEEKQYLLIKYLIALHRRDQSRRLDVDRQARELDDGPAASSR